MIMRIFKKNKKGKGSLVNPDEIFLDSQNLQNFDRQQFEGRIEKPIPKSTILLLGIFFIVITLVFGTRLSYLQIHKGLAYRERSENNTLEKAILFADRGIIYDRNGRELAWNKKPTLVPEAHPEAGPPGGQDAEDTEDSPSIRAYFSPGFSHVLGYVSYPAKDNSGNYWQSKFIAKDGLEKQYDDTLEGQNGSKIIELNALGEIFSENIINIPERGKDLRTTIDSRIQEQIFSLIEDLSMTNDFNGGAGIIMDVQNGEVIASTSFPEYNSEILSLGKDKEKINIYMTDQRRFFLDRIISGLYTPGSIVKPFIALGALEEGVIDSNKKILSTGSISIPNPYFPDQPSVFKDWKVHGWTNMAEAIAVSSDVYFYSIGGGFETQRGMGIANIEKYIRLFGIGELTGIDLPDETKGVIPNPDWKKDNFDNDPWRVGDTYNTSIGQYGFQVTPMEMARAIGALANGGRLVTPHFDLEALPLNGGDTSRYIDLKKEYLDVIHDGMRQAVTYGTAVALNVPYVEVAAKTGTAQLGLAKDRVNSWVTGFFPYENPKYTFTILMESGPREGSVGASSIMRGLLDWMSINTPEYFE
jgi:penicillin-binding protein 2